MLKEFIKKAKEQGSATIEPCGEVTLLLDFEDFNELTIFGTIRTRSFKLPKKLTPEWIEKKISTFQNTDYTPISKLVKEEMGKLGLDGCIIYPTSYGIGISTLYKSDEDKLQKTVDEVEKILSLNGYIINKKEFSEHYWVYRIKISTKNLKKVA